MLPARLTGIAAAFGAVAVVSVLIGVVSGPIGVANTSMLYLIAVLGIAVRFGRWPAVLASIAAFLTFNFLFVDPIHSFTVSDPAEWVALVLFLLTAIVTGELAANQRRRAAEAEQREREAVVLYDVVRLMGEANLDRSLQAVAERLRVELSLSAVAIDLGDRGDGPLVAVGDSEGIELARSSTFERSRALGMGRPPSAAERGTPGRWVRVSPPRPPGFRPRGPSDRLFTVPLATGERRLGSLALVRPASSPPFGPEDDRLLSAVAAQIVFAVERARYREEATEGELLRRTDELKTALLNAVSHDLRTPLASIIASAGSLRQNDVRWTDEERGEFASAIEEEAQRLNRIVGNLLDLSRIEGESLQLQRAWYDLGALIDDVLGRLRSVTSGHRVATDVPDDLPPVPIDYVAIDQVLSNLVENAAKYTPEGSSIRVGARCDGEAIRIEVEDSGPGVPPRALPHLFDRFYRGEPAGSSRSKPRGTGLGLAVAKGLVEAHGGHVWAENLPGGGARFAFTLPLTAPGGADS